MLLTRVQQRSERRGERDGHDAKTSTSTARWRSSPAPAAASGGRSPSSSPARAPGCSPSTSTPTPPRRPRSPAARSVSRRRATRATWPTSTPCGRWPTGCTTAHGPLDVLVNNAGVGMSARFADMTVDDWRWIRGVNLDGVVHGCQAFGPAMLERGPRPRREPVVRPRLHAAGHRAGLRHHQGRGARAVAVPAGRLAGLGRRRQRRVPRRHQHADPRRHPLPRRPGRDRGAHTQGVPPGPPPRARRPRGRRRHPPRTGPSSPWGGRPSSAGGPTACCPWPVHQRVARQGL